MEKIKSKKRLIGGYSSRVTSKFQATIPHEIRKHLHLEQGDEILYELLSDNTVTVRRTSPIDVDYLKALTPTLSEWETKEDEEAYKNL